MRRRPTRVDGRTVVGGLVLVAVAVLFVPVLSPPEALAQTAPCHVPKPPPGTEATPDFATTFYVFNGEPRTVDFYFPDDPPADPDVGYPVLVWVHGGGWRNYTQALLPSEGIFQRLEDGYAIASIDYRQTCEIEPLTGAQVAWPQPLYDIWTAIIWTREFIDPARPDLQLDTERFVLWGGSTGGHMATLAATAANNSGLASRLPIVGVASLYGVYDLTDARLDEIIEGSEPPRRRWWVGEAMESLLDCGPGGATQQCALPLRWHASPIAYLDPDDPPILLMHGRNDQLVPYQNAEHFWQSASWVRGVNWGDPLVNDRTNGTDRFIYFRSTSRLDIDSQSATCVVNEGYELLDGDHGCVTGPEVPIVAAGITQFMRALIE